MAKTETLHIRVEPQIKESADRTFKVLGITTAEAVSIFLHQAIITGGLPFDARIPRRFNDTTGAALSEARMLLHDPQAKSYGSISEATYAQTSKTNCLRKQKLPHEAETPFNKTICRN